LKKKYIRVKTKTRCEFQKTGIERKKREQDWARGRLEEENFGFSLEEKKGDRGAANKERNRNPICAETEFQSKTLSIPSFRG